MMYKFLLLFLLVSCGSSSHESTETPQEPKPFPRPSPGVDDLTFNSDIKPLLNTYCAQCHSDDSFMTSESKFLSSDAPNRIANKSMPLKQGKNYSKFGDAQRGIFAEFVDDKK